MDSTSEGLFGLDGDGTIALANPAAPRLHLEVHDTGVGLSPEQQAQIFEPFVQADPFTNRRHGGTGLGLAIIRRLAQLLGGAIGMQSQPGQSSTLWVQLPVHIPTLPAAAALSAPASSGAQKTQFP